MKASIFVITLIKAAEPIGPKGKQVIKWSTFSYNSSTELTTRAPFELGELKSREFLSCTVNKNPALIRF